MYTVKLTTLVFLSLAIALTLNTPTPARVVGTSLGHSNPHLEKEKLGKLFIKTAPVAEGEFADPKLEDTVKDLKNCHCR
jgi:hypothetical protein